MTSNLHGPYGLGYTRATMAITIGSRAVRRSDVRGKEAITQKRREGEGEIDRDEETMM